MASPDVSIYVDLLEIHVRLWHADDFSAFEQEIAQIRRGVCALNAESEMRDWAPRTRTRGKRSAHCAVEGCFANK